MSDCDHAKRIHERPVVLMTYRLGDLVTTITRYAVVRCYACGAKWIEDDVIRAEPKG
ncbi:MAG: hypothetical protein HY403_01755 [Elusimicrobia bacterium]|nr:hypothetical protein [Elusimicrobiota bacterium]